MKIFSFIPTCLFFVACANVTKENIVVIKAQMEIKSDSVEAFKTMAQNIIYHTEKRRVVWNIHSIKMHIIQLSFSFMKNIKTKMLLHFIVNSLILNILEKDVNICYCKEQNRVLLFIGLVS